MRFKCVSKWWYDRITNQSFALKHLSNSANNSLTTRDLLLKRLVVQQQHEEEETEQVFMLLKLCKDDDNINDEDSNSYSLAGVQDIVFPHSLIQKVGVPEQLHIIGHCNDIVFLYSKSSFVLCNPGIEEFIRVPNEPCLPMWPRLGLDLREDYNWPEHIDTGFHPGFHYDTKSNEYKFVAFTTYTQESDDIMTLTVSHKVVVYTISCDSWKEVGTVSLEAETTLFWPDGFLMCFKGMCFWLGIEQDKEISVYGTFDDPESGRVIISFDTSHEVFRGIPEPSELQRLPLRCDLDLKLIVWNESVSYGSQ